MYIILEGLDKTGKTTIKEELKKKKYGSCKNVVIDRGPASNLFFDDILNRSTDKRKKEFLKDIYDLENIDGIIVYCKSSKEDIVDRHVKAKEKVPYYILDKKEEVEEKYLEYCFLYNKNMIIVDTSLLTKKQVLNEILKEVNYIQTQKGE